LPVDSVVVVILAVSCVSLPVVVVMRRLINRPGGLAAGALLSLPLVLPLLLALAHGHPTIPRIGVLRPALAALLEGPGRPEELVLLRAQGGRIVIPYVLAASVGTSLLVGAAALSLLMLLRRVAGAQALRRLKRISKVASERGHRDLVATVERLSARAGLGAAPEVFILPRGMTGAFASGGGRGRIFVGRDLLSCLDDTELEATLAHEVAHLEARDVRLVAAAGVLRDVMFWNPLAHLALRCLRVDRELEADRRAATLTGRPLALASSLLKLCELSGRRDASPRAALGFGPSRGRVGHRVTTLLVLADGKSSAAAPTHLPFLVAGAMAAALALQVSAYVTRDEGRALSLVLGAPTSEAARVWSPSDDSWAMKKNAAAAQKAERPRADRESKRLQKLNPRLRALASLEAAPAIEERDFKRWTKTVSWIVTHRAKVDRIKSLLAPQSWEVQPLLAKPSIGLISIYRVGRLTLPSGVGGPPSR